MAEVSPFRGVRYNQTRVKDLNLVVAPPYDVIRPELQEELHRRSPYNVVRLILGQDLPGDDARRNKYQRAAEQYRQWLTEGVLCRDESPAFYLYHLHFDLKTPDGIVRQQRRGLLGRLRLSPYSERVVLPHERTLAAAKEDRFRLLSATRVWFSPVFVLFQEAGQELMKGLESFTAAAPDGECRESNGVWHRMWRLKEPEVAASITTFFEPRRLFLADGHHRYETGLRYWEEMRRARPEAAAGAEWILAYFTPAEDPGLVIFPYHRLLHHLEPSRLAGLRDQLRGGFEVIPAARSPLPAGPGRREFIQQLVSYGRDGTAFGLVFADGSAYWVVAQPGRENATEASLAARLDVTRLEKQVLEKLLGINHQALVEEKNVTYETDYDRVFEALGRGSYQAAFLLNPTPVAQVLAVAAAGEIMPEKSTYFFPKPLSGLVMHPLDG